MFNKVGGRKFILAVVFAVIFIANDMAGQILEETTIENILYVIGSFIGVEGVADIVERFKKK